MGLIENLGRVILKPIVGAGNAITKVIEGKDKGKFGRTTAREAAATPFCKILTTGILATTAGLAFKVAPIITKKVATVAVPIAVLAPKTAAKATQNPEILEVTLAAAVNPVAGVVVGLEKGTSFIAAGAEDVNTKVKEKAPEITGAIGETTEKVTEFVKEHQVPFAALGGVAALGGIAAIVAASKPDIPAILNTFSQPREVLAEDPIIETLPEPVITQETASLTPQSTNGGKVDVRVNVTNKAIAKVFK